MQHRTNFKYRFTRLLPTLLGVFVMWGFLVGAQSASAQLSGPTVTGQVCMQTTYSGQTAAPVPNSVNLNCTANDVRIAEATEVSPNTCVEGSTISLLTATFRIEVTANERYDTGFYFNTQGGASARLGTCSLSVLDPELDPGLNLEGDFCGDLNSGEVFATFEIPNVKCEAAPGSDPPVLRLPNCTAWHSNQGTLCSENTDADPDTKSKCVCDDDFTVPVIVETATLLVEKSASPTMVPETGGTVTYTVNITNQASFVNLTLDTIIDVPYGNVGAGNPTGITENTCPNLIGNVLAPGSSTSCSFKAFVFGNSGDDVTDVVEVCGIDEGQNNVCGDDDATVEITDVQTAPSLAKTAQSATCQVDVTYQVVVSNNSDIDTLTVNALSDDKFGDITTMHDNVISTTCDTAPGTVVGPLGNLTCSFVGRVSDSCDFTHQNTVTGDTEDEDGVSFTPAGSATVTVEISGLP